jgi:hypothetical protein
MASFRRAFGVLVAMSVTPAIASNRKETPIMPRNTLWFGTLLACGIFALATRVSSAGGAIDDKDKTSLSGSWEKKDAEAKLKFTTEGALTIYPHGDSLNLQIECSYTVDKEGLVKAKVKSVAGAENVVEKVKEVVPVGMEFEFKWKVDGEAATLGEVDGKDADHVKARLEGDYAKKE